MEKKICKGLKFSPVEIKVAKQIARSRGIAVATLIAEIVQGILHDPTISEQLFGGAKKTRVSIRLTPGEIERARAGGRMTTRVLTRMAAMMGDGK